LVNKEVNVFGRPNDNTMYGQSVAASQREAVSLGRLQRDFGDLSLKCV
jgi:hypothetical protein